jgi:ArsR family transcriptional regulator
MRILSLIKAEAGEGITFALEKVYSLQSSLCLIRDSVDGLHPWVNRMREILSEEELRDTHRFCMTNTFLDGKTWESVDDWLDYVGGLSDEQMIASELGHLREKISGFADLAEKMPSDQELLENEDAFVGIISEFWKREEMEIDEEAIRDEHYLLTHPAEKREFIIRHFRHMYDNYLRSEWELHEQDLLDSVRAFSSVDYDSRDRGEAVLEIIQRTSMDEGVMKMFAEARQIIFIPSAHVGPYIMIIDSREGILRIVHGARIPEGAVIRSPSLVRSELLLRLEAVADEHRLRILRIIADRGEVSSQEVIDQMDLSQSSVSRHLKQLTANGFIQVRNIDRSKYFSLNMNRFDTLFQTMKRYLGG